MAPIKATLAGMGIDLGGAEHGGLAGEHRLFGAICGDMGSGEHDLEEEVPASALGGRDEMAGQVGSCGGISAAG